MHPAPRRITRTTRPRRLSAPAPPISQGGVHRPGTGLPALAAILEAAACRSTPAPALFTPGPSLPPPSKRTLSYPRSRSSRTPRSHDPGGLLRSAANTPPRSRTGTLHATAAGCTPAAAAALPPATLHAVVSPWLPTSPLESQRVPSAPCTSSPDHPSACSARLGPTHNHHAGGLRQTTPLGRAPSRSRRRLPRRRAAIQRRVRSEAG